MSDQFGDRDYARQQDTGTAKPCVVVGIDLSGDPMVTVRPMQATRVVDLDGAVNHLPALEIAEVPYCYPSGNRFAVFVPPEIGMQGYLVTTQHEVGEAGQGTQQVTRTKDIGSGFFVPSGNLTGTAFRGSADWAEFRSRACRVALSDDVLHLQAGSSSIIVDASGFDVVAGGVSLVAALKQLSDHIGRLEALVHPNGMVHGPVQQRLVDQFLAAAVPARTETGVR